MSKRSWFRRLLRLFEAAPPSASERLAEQAFPRAYPLRLEDRHVLDGVPLIQMDPQGMVSVSAGAGANDGQADVFEAVRVESESGSKLQIKFGGETAAEFRFDDVKQITIEGSSDADVLRIDANAIPLGGIVFLGDPAFERGAGPLGVPAGIDRLELRGAATNGATLGAVTHQLGSAQSAITLTSTTGGIAYSGIEQVDDGLLVSDRHVVAATELTVQWRGVDRSPDSSQLLVADGQTLTMRHATESFSLAGSDITIAGSIHLPSIRADVEATRSLRVASDATLQVTHGQLRLAAEQLTVDGTVAVGSGGELRLAASADGSATIRGRLDAAGLGASEAGGLIEVTGGSIWVASTGQIDATGRAGGGQIRIGASTFDVSQIVDGSRQMTLEAGGVVDASAVERGDGGQILLWGDESLVVAGEVRARGGALAGNGGFVETSTLGGFAITRAPVVTAAAGLGGTWLLDPTDLSVVASGGDAGFTPTGGVFTSDATHTKLDVAVLLAAMGPGVTVELRTGSVDTPGNSGDITIKTDINYNGKGAGTLRLTAHRSISIEGKISDGTPGGGDSLNLVLTAGTASTSATTTIAESIATQGGSFTATGAEFKMNNTRSIDTAGGNFTVSTGAGKSISLEKVSVGAGNISLTSDLIDLAGGANSVTGTGTILLQPLTVSRTIGLGGASGDYNLTDAEINALTNGFSQITIGRSNGTGGITISDASFRDPLVLQSPSGGTISVTTELRGTDNASLRIVGSGSTTVLSGNVVTAGTTIDFADAVQVTNAVTVDSTNAGTVAAGANITFQFTVDDAPAAGVGSLTVRAGTSGDATFTGAIGATRRLSSLNVTSDVATFSSTIAVNGNVTVNAAGNATFDGELDSTGSLSVTSGGTTTFNSAATVGNSVTLANTGALTIASGATFTVANSFSQTGAGAVSLGADIKTTNDPISFAANVTLTGSVLLKSDFSGAAGGNVTLSGTVNATAAEALTVEAGTGGDITFIGAVGNSTPLGSLTVTGEIVAFSDTVDVAGSLDANSIGAMSFADAVTVDGTVSLTNGGLLTISGPADFVSTGSFTQDGAGNVSLGGDIKTTDSAIEFQSPITLTASVLLQSDYLGTTGANITLGDTVDSTAGEDLTLDGGTDGDLEVTGAIGSATPLGALQANGRNLRFSDTIELDDDLLATSFGTLAFAGAATVGGLATLDNAGLLTIDNGADFTVTGAFTQIGLGAVQLGGDVLTTDSVISFRSAIALTQDVELNTANGGGSGADLTLSDDVTGTTGAEALTLNAGTAGDIAAAALGTSAPNSAVDGLDIVGADDVVIDSIVTTNGFTSTSNTLTLNGAIDSSGDEVNLRLEGAAPGPVLTLQAVDTNGQNFTVSAAAEIQFAAGADSIRSTGGGGVFTLQGTGISTTLGIGTGAPGDLQITDAMLAAIGPGFTGGIVFGSAGQTGQLTFSGAPQHYDQSLTIRANGGADVDINTSLDTNEGSADNKNLTIDTGASSVTTLAGNLTTEGGDIVIRGGRLQIDGAAPVLIRSGIGNGSASSAGEINLSGLVDIIGASAGNQLTIDARQGGVNNSDADDGQIDLPARIGSAGAGEALANLTTFTESNVTVVHSSGAAASIRLQGTSGVTALSMDSRVYLRGNTTVQVLPGNVDLSAATISGQVAGRFLTVNTTDGGAGADGILTFGETNSAGGFALSNLTFITSDGAGSPGTLRFDHPGSGPQSIALGGSFLHTGQRVIVVDSTTIASSGGAVTLNGQIDASAVGKTLTLSASGDVNPGSIGSFGGGAFLSGVRLTSTAGNVILNEGITIDDPTGLGVGIQITGKTRLDADTTLRSEFGGDHNAAPIDLSAADVFANAPGWTLTIDALSAVGAGGSVSLGQFSNNGGAGSYVRTLQVRATGGAGAGNMTLHGNLSLDDAAGTPALFEFDGRDVIVAQNVVVDTETGNNANGGNIDWGSSRVSASVADRRLTLDAVGSGDGGTIRMGEVGSASGGQFLGGLTLRTTGNGEILPGGNILTDSPSVGVGTGVTVVGRIVAPTPSGSTLLIDTEQGNNHNGSPINLDQASLAAANANVGLELNSSGNTAGGPVTLGSFEPWGTRQRFESLLINADGTSGAAGAVQFTDPATLNGPITISHAGNVAFGANVTSGAAVQVNSEGVIQGTGVVTANSLDLTAASGIYGGSPVTPLQVSAPALTAAVTGPGPLRIANNFAGDVSVHGLSTANGDLSYNQTGGGEMLVVGNVIAQGDNEITLTGDGDIRVGAAGNVETTGATSSVTINAGGTIAIDSGGRVAVGTGTGDPGVIGRVPPVVTIVPQIQPNGGNVADDGQAAIDITLGDPLVVAEDGFTVTVNWGDGTFTVVNDAGPTLTQSHTYLKNPDPGNPLAPIPVTVTAVIDTRIVLNDSTPGPLNQGSTTTDLIVPGEFFAFTQVQPPAPIPAPRIVREAVVIPAIATQTSASILTQQRETGTVAVSASPAEQRKFVLRIVLPDVQLQNQEPVERELKDDELNDLAGLFRRLPDGRYQIWLKLEDGSRHLVKDVFVRDGKATDLEESLPEDADDNPIVDPTGRQADSATRAAEELAAWSGDSGPGSSSAAVGVGVGAGDWSDERRESADSEQAWSDRARQALRDADERAFSKARRLLRRGSV